MQNKIEIQQLCKRYANDVIALDNISLEIDPGELFGIIGPDGAGKTTLFRILTTLILPDSGMANVAGFDVVKDFWEIRKRVGYMPGRFSLYQDLTVLENLNFFATVFNTTVETNYEFIRDIYVQLEPFKRRRAGKLSGGMKQKLALCCALIHQPAVLFLDEPTTGVDPVSRTEFWDLLAALKQRGITILVSTPYMDEAARCDRIALLQKGNIMDLDTHENILNKHHKPLRSVRSNNMFKLLNDLRNYPNCRNCYSFGSVHHLVLKEDHAEVEQNLHTYLESLGHGEIMINLARTEIEDVFIDLMSEVT